MRNFWRDIISTLLVIAGGVVVFAKLQSYSWWLIGSWKGALGVIAVLGLGVLLTSVVELVKFEDLSTSFETLLWLITATIAIGSFAATTTKLEFVSTAAAIGISWLAQVTEHVWKIEHNHNNVRYLPVH